MSQRAPGNLVPKASRRIHGGISFVMHERKLRQPQSIMSPTVSKAPLVGRTTLRFGTSLDPQAMPRSTQVDSFSIAAAFLWCITKEIPPWNGFHRYPIVSKSFKLGKIQLASIVFFGLKHVIATKTINYFQTICIAAPLLRAV